MCSGKFGQVVKLSAFLHCAARGAATSMPLERTVATAQAY
jgi:hypothetical protein